MNTREEIINLLSKSKKPLGPKTIALELKKNSVNIRKILSNLCKEGKIGKTGYGEYTEKEKERAYFKQYYLEHKEELEKKQRAYSKQYYIKHKGEQRERNKAYLKQWRKENPEKYRKTKNQYAKCRYKTDIKFNLNTRICRAIGKALKGNKNGKHWEDLVGYSLAGLTKRLKKTMPKGYTWQDYLNGDLHIDHITPIAVFNFTKPEHVDFKRCWALNNLRLLPARENLIKNAKLIRPFQPTLQV